MKQPTFPEKVCTAYACAEPIQEALAVPKRHERNRNQRGRMQKNCPGPYPLRCGDRQHRHPRPGIVVAFGSGFLTPVNVFVCFELQKIEPDLNKIAVWMQRYFYAVALQGMMQVAIIVVMTRFRIGV